MRVVIQRVSKAEVKVNGTVKGSCKLGLLILAGIEEADTEEDAIWLSGKIVNLRIFSDEQDKMNLSVKDVRNTGGQPVYITCKYSKRKSPFLHFSSPARKSASFI